MDMGCAWGCVEELLELQDGPTGEQMRSGGSPRDVDCRAHSHRSSEVVGWEHGCISWCSQSCCCRKEWGIAGTVRSLSCRNIVINLIKPTWAGMGRWD